MRYSIRVGIGLLLVGFAVDMLWIHSGWLFFGTFALVMIWATFGKYKPKEYVHEMICSECRDAKQIIAIRQANGREFGTDISLANVANHCDLARDMVDAEDKRLRIGY